MRRLSAAILAVAWAVGVQGADGMDPPGLSVAASEPQVAQPPGGVSCAAGRFVPLNITSGAPTLLLGNEMGLLEIYPLAKGESIHGIRYDEPAGAKVKRYTFPKGATHYAVAGETVGVVTLTAIVNGKVEKDKPQEAPTVAGRLIITLTGPMPPPGPIPPGPVPPGPVPPGPTPPPQPVTAFRVIFVTESATTLTPQQNAVCGAKAVRDYLNAKVTKDANWPGWRNYDPQTTAANEYPGVKAVWEAAKPQITTVPCMVVQVNDKITIEPFPANATAALATLQSYGGK